MFWSHQLDDLSATLPEKEFTDYGAAEEVMLNFTSIVRDAGEVKSVGVLNSTMSFFTEVLVRNPLGNATADDARSFLNVSVYKRNIFGSNKKLAKDWS